MAKAGKASVCLVAAFLCVSLHAAAEPPAISGSKLNDLSLEVSALQTIYALQLTAVQMEQLRKLAKDAADPSGGRVPGHASDKFRRAMLDLREALVKAKDDEWIQKLNEQLDKITDSEKPRLDDSVEITDEARDAVPDFMRVLTPAQAAAYLGGLADTVGDPRAKLQEAVKKVRGLSEKDYRALRDEVTQDVSGLLAGLDADQASRVTEQVAQLLILARDIKDADIKKEQPVIDKRIQAIIGKVGPMDVLRHVLEQNLAQLLANPQLQTALAERLK